MDRQIGKGKARWGDLPTAAPVDSDDGQDLLDRGWEATKEEFERNLDRVKEALDERQSNENLSLYIDHHGVSGLATAIEYARAYTQSEMNARIMSREQDIPVLEAETILQELQEIILETEPDTATNLDIEELDAAVDERMDE